MSKNSHSTGKDSVAKAIRRNLSFKRLGGHAARAGAVLRSEGWQALGRELAFRVNLATHREIWRYRADIPLNKQLKAQRRQVFEKMPLISIVVPLFNTPPLFLKQLLNSVYNQSYTNWELILVDAGASKSYHGQAGAVKTGGVVRYIFLGKNEGIAGNTNIGLAECKGEYITLLDHDDVLQKNALYEVVKAINETGADLIYSDEVVLSEDLKHLSEFHFKPDYAPYTLLGCNYFTHLCAFNAALLARAGHENPAYNGAQDYDLVLRLTEKAEHICHIPKVLYFWRQHGGSTASGIENKAYAVQAGANAVQAHLARTGVPGEAIPQKEHAGSYRLKLALPEAEKQKISVIIPNKDHTDDLRRCLDSLYAKAGQVPFEVIVVENNSSREETLDFYREALSAYPNFRIVQYEGAFNFSAICNFGASFATGEHILLLNNDTEITGEDFLAEMLSFSMQKDVGAVGCMLYYPDDTVQHGGLIVGIGGTAGVSHKCHPRGDGGDMFRLCTVQNVSAVTGAALMVKKELYDALGGLNEQDFAVAFNDVDFCLRLLEKGFWNIFTPFATAYHYESKSRGYDTEGAAKERFDREAAAFKQRHAAILQKGDPFYNRHFTLEYENFGFR